MSDKQPITYNQDSLNKAIELTSGIITEQAIKDELKGRKSRKDLKIDRLQLISLYIADYYLSVECAKKLINKRIDEGHEEVSIRYHHRKKGFFSEVRELLS